MSFIYSFLITFNVRVLDYYDFRDWGAGLYKEDNNTFLMCPIDCTTVVCSGKVESGTG